MADVAIKGGVNMLELTYIGTPQTVEANAPIVYNTHTASTCQNEVRWRGGTGTIHLPKGRYVITFMGNIAIPADGTVGEMSIAIKQDGEIIAGTTARMTPAAVNVYENISTHAYINVGCGCESISVSNVGEAAILVESPNVIIARI